MKKLLPCILLFCAYFTHVTAGSSTLPLCNDHKQEISMIRNEAAESIYKAHRNGGRLFRSSFVFTAQDAAYDSVSFERTYTQFSAVFNEFMSYCQPAGIPALWQGEAKMAEGFLEMYNNCIKKHANLAARYQRGKIYFDKGLYENCLTDIQSIVESGKWESSEKDKIDENNFLLMRGIAQLESSNYEEAINILCDLIKKDPANQEAYFHRASAYFETGDFELSLRDCIISEKFKGVDKVKPKTSNEFNVALSQGLLEGGKTWAIELLPSLLESLHGLGTSLWSFVKAPIDSTTNFYNACYETGEVVVEYIKTLDKEQIEEMALEIQELYHRFDSLNDAEKGHAIGYCIGRYGVDIFAGCATLKSAQVVSRLKTANRMANLEALVASEKSREAIKAAAVTHSAKREAYIVNAKIHWDRQNKHIQGKHNFDPSRGHITLENNMLETLIKEHAGKGQKVNKSAPFSPGYKERIDFEMQIGTFALKGVGDETIFMPTNRGILHYSKEGVHLVPSAPKGFEP